MTTFDAFARFAHAAPPTPPQPGQAPRPAEERLAYHSQFVTVRTPAIESLARQVRTLMILGRHQQATARPSLILTGPATTGKTTALLQVGRTCHLAHTRRAAPGDDRVPVAYVLVPPGATAKTLAAEFARYLGIPVAARMTTAQITTAVCHTYTTAGVALVLIDEIHRLNPRTSSGAEAADWLKDLTERIGATFVYAGIDVTASAVFSGVRGAQLAGRASLIDCGALPARAGHREPFRELITALETALDLTAHRPGTLPRHNELPPSETEQHQVTTKINKHTTSYAIAGVAVSGTVVERERAAVVETRGPVGRGWSSGVVRAWWAARRRRAVMPEGGPVRQEAVSGAMRARCAARGAPSWAMWCMRWARTGH
ncbi:TniB family NTP-binding protein [Streptomyces griseus]